MSMDAAQVPSGQLDRRVRIRYRQLDCHSGRVMSAEMTA